MNDDRTDNTVLKVPKAVGIAVLSAALFVLLAIISCSSGGSDSSDTNGVVTASSPYSVGILLEADGLRNGPDYAGATVYYPADAEPPFASIVIVPGYLFEESSIQEWGPFYASYGIVAMTIGTNSGTDNPDARANALIDAAETLRQENTRADSPLNGKLDIERIALSGWSMGGGGAQLAAVMDPSFKAVVALCPWLDITELTVSDLNHTVPLLIISGQLDTVAPPSENANIHYDYTPTTTDKLLYEVFQGPHNVANGPDVTNAEGVSYSNGEVGQFALAWLRVYLEDDVSYRPSLFEVPESASNYETNLEP